MPHETIAEGSGWAALRAALDNIEPGQKVELELTFDRDLTDDELAQVEEALTGVADVKLLSIRSLRLNVRAPSSQERVGIVWFLPLLAIGGILTGLAGWRIMTATPSSILRVAVPLALVGIGAWMLYKKVVK